MPAPTDFFTLADAKAWLSITGTDSDTLLAIAIPYATSAVVGFLNWDPNPQQVTELLNGNNGCEIGVNRRGVSAVSAINFLRDDGSLYAVSLTATPVYWTEYSVGLRGGRFPRGRGNIQITYTAGLVPMPAAIQLGALMTLKALWVGKDVDQHTAAEAFDGVVSAPFWATGPGSVPPQARSLLGQYKSVFHA